MKISHYIIPTLLLLISFSSKGQTFGNEWINYNQNYYSFGIVEDGIYTLDYNTINAAGIPVASIQSANFQIFGKEQEIPLHIVDGGDNSIDPGDYILFYAEHNDGWLDSTIYRDPETIGNPMYSLYNDTLVYFLTWNNSTSNLRYTVETAVDFANYTSVAPYIEYLAQNNSNVWYLDGVAASETSSSFYVAGEGWGSGLYNGVSGGTVVNLQLNTPTPYTGPGAPEAIFKGLSVSGSNAGGSPNHHLAWELGASTTLLDTTFYGYTQVICNKKVSNTLLSNGNTPIRFRIIDDLGVATDYQAYSYYGLTYARTPNFGGANDISFKVINDPQGKIRLDISNAGYSNPIMLVHGDTPRMVPFVANSGGHSALIPNSANGEKQKVIYKDSSLVMSVNSLSPVNGNGTFVDYLSMAGGIDDALLIIHHPQMISSATDYAAYRESIEGGNHNVILANTEDLYNQFGGGIEKHINGIRRFAHYIYSNATDKPVGLFLAGKGIREAIINGTVSGGGTRKFPFMFEESMIPSFGHPSSDAIITAGLEGPYNWAPLIPTGRISARNNADLSNYLNKVKEYETQQDQSSIYDTPSKDWQKQIIHFAGGSDANEQDDFQGYLEGMESKIEDSLFGGNVHRIYKTSSNPLDPTILSEVTNRISEGVSLMSYFGHFSATGSGFEINLDDPANWNNQGKYPVMLVNSCYNGNIFTYDANKSEEFVQVPDYGAIAYIASVGVGFSYYLNNYSQNLYQRMSRTMYGATLGEQMKANAEAMDPQSWGDLLLESTVTQMALNGDPMLKLNWHQEPEIELLASNVSFSPNNLNLTVDSIEVSIVLNNLGHSVLDTFELRVERSFPGTSIDSVYTFLLPTLHYKDTINFKVPMQPNISVGLNTFTITADIPSIIPEQYDETNNNQLVVPLYINIDGIIPVTPYEFAVVPDPDVTVQASTIDPIAGYATYRFEIDTVDFEGTVPQSGEYRYALVSGFGGVHEVAPGDWLNVATGMSDPLVCEDSVVYFWRVSIVDTAMDWRESSFQHIVGKTGWGQDHFYQFKKNGYSNLDYDRPNRLRHFFPDQKELDVDVLSTPFLPAAFYNTIDFDGELIAYGIGLTQSYKLHVSVIDPSDFSWWFANDPNYAYFGHENQVQNTEYFTFRQDNPTQLEGFRTMINDIPSDHYVLIYSPIAPGYNFWNALPPADSAAMYNTFAGLGFDSIQPTNNQNRVFCLFRKMDDPTSIVQVIAPYDNADINMVTDIIGSDREGGETSTLIGPASEWGNVYWKQDPEEASSTDSTILTIQAYDINGIAQVSIDTLFTADDSLLNLNSLFPAATYPYIDLHAYHVDSVTYTPAQIDRWHVLFSPLPEAAIDGTSQYYWSLTTDTLSEGQTVDFAVDVKNIFTIDMDSLLINYWIQDANNNIIPINYPRQDSLRVGDILRDTITINTIGLSGNNSLWMEVNPYVNGSFVLTDQPEQEHFNNLLQIPFFVMPDDKHPILDVTFNGNHILNGDIVDPNSEILITLKDDNEFMIMDNVSDTTLFGVYLTDPAGNLTRIPFVSSNGETVMQWIPADAQHKKFKILWPTELSMNGTYTLFVQGSDRSGNLSGDLEYKVDFEVIHESTITHMMNYPNPFSTSTRFVFTLTGSQEPDEIIIQIMTVTGRLVREITEDELGPIQIGRNISEYAWDGTDEFGDPLANGVYLYRVKAQIGGEDIKHRESGADQHFHKNFGKMYLMR